MYETLEKLDAKCVIHSATGLREGYLYSLLNEEEQAQDALLEATAELAILRSRSPQHCIELAEWTEEAFRVLKFKETERQARWRVATCNLADIAWRSASDYRAEQALGIINNAGFNSISHEGRAFLAITNFHWYRGLGPKKEPPAIARLASEETRSRARVLAAIFRLVHLYSALEPGVLPHLKLERSPYGNLVFEVPQEFSNLNGERTQHRLEQLGREIGEEITIQPA